MSVVPLVHACVVWNNYLYRLQDAREVTSPEKTQRETRQCDSERGTQQQEARERRRAYADERAPRVGRRPPCVQVWVRRPANGEPPEPTGQSQYCYWEYT